MHTLTAKKREILGKKNKTLREKGLIPGVIYGGVDEAKSVEINLRDFQKVWEEAGESALIELETDGEKKNVLIKDVQVDPVSEAPTHADFYAVRMDEVIEATVPIEFIGESPAVKSKGAVLVRVMHELEVEALPKDLPGKLEVDVSKLENFDDRFLVKNLNIPSGVKILANPEDIIALTEEPKAEEEEATAPSIEDIEVVGKKGKEEEDAGEEKPSEKEEKAKEEKSEK